MLTDTDVLIVGAGAAGLAAARRLAALGRTCVILEAGDRVGGRAWTTPLLGTPFDCGAVWLHEADDNPLTPLARDLGLVLHEEGGAPERVRVGDRPATPAELVEYAAAWDRFGPAVERAAQDGGPDRPVSSAAPAGGAWDATVAYWSGPVINGARLEETSLHDFVATDLGGRNLLPEVGMGGLLTRLAEGLPIRLGHAVTGLRWDGHGVTATGDFGTLRAAAAIVTVSTAVLAAGGLRFDPALPPTITEACAMLPLGQVEKVGLPLRPGALAELAPHTRLERQVQGTADRPMTWICRPFGRPYLMGWLGAALAAAAAREGPAATIALAREALTGHLGPEAVARAIGPDPLVTRWGTDPCFRGAYSHARVGGQAARVTLADAALGDGRLRFAGEACHARYAGTVGGAWDSGAGAADRVSRRGPR